MGEPRPVEIKSPGQIIKVQTLADGGLRWTFDIQEDQVLQSSWLMECRRHCVTGWVTFEPDWSALDERDEERPGTISIG